ncbi:hypothetical protein Ssi02_65870 [Sinosporangium siamense]|uniref:Uncharacterized protein n=2 Tax=Sinosporangium siamense TaxID=1367973 RepID=A0A919RQ31_9ACTN|nr:hypothetical protein Ssi02_65870 [Sinosporangium siamense]
MGYTVALAALHGLGLTGPGTDAVARGLLGELLAEGGIAVQVAMTQTDAARLLGTREKPRVEGWEVFANRQELLTHLQVEIVRRRGQRDGGAAAEDLPWLFAITSPGDAAEALHEVVDGGAEDLIMGIVLGEWPYGITCTVDDDGHITGLVGAGAPSWVGRRLPTLTTTELTWLML